MAATSEDEMRKFRAVFDQFDANGDGVLSYDELRSALVGIGYQMHEGKFQRFLDDADVDRDGEITFEEFVAAVRKRPTKQQTLAKIKRMFRMMDTDGSGYITLRDLKTLVRESGSDVPTDQLKQIILNLDVDGDRKISFEEFAVHFSRK